MSGAPRERVDGLLLLDKPRGMTSNAALQQAKRLLNAERGGHGGTLDPLASGLLPLLFGEATKFASQALEGDKRYLAELRLGIRTDTGDAEGAVIETRPVAIDPQHLDSALARFRGDILQTPPMHSALKHRGRPLYAYARAGESVAREPRPVRIHELTLRSFVAETLVLAVHCSKGTYIRTLAEDLGEILGCGAHLSALQRTAVGPFDLDRALTPAALEEASLEMRRAALMPLESLLTSLPKLRLQTDLARRFALGQRICPPDLQRGMVAVYDAQDSFLGLGQADEEGVLHPRRLLRAA